jgi:hypothetical protein
MKIQQTLRSVITIASLGCLSALTLTAAEESQAALKAEATIKLAQAEKTALAKVPGGKIRSEELERENGRVVWSFEFSMPNTKSITEVQVDAKSGKVVSTEIETAKDQADEAAADRKEKKNRLLYSRK